MLKRKVNLQWISIAMIVGLVLSACAMHQSEVENRPVVVLTFDDAVQSHLDFVAPLLKEYGFNASFYITYQWMDDTVNFMSWDDVSELSEMGFEIGNHSWSHSNFSQPVQAFELEGELIMMEWMLDQVGVPKPVTYAHTGNAFGPEAISTLARLGYVFARRGKQPEIEYGSLEPGSGYDPQKHHPLLIPTTLDFYPGMNLEIFEKAMSVIPTNEIAVLQFHGVPDVAHPWVSTPEADFVQYMDYLKDHDYRVIAMRDLAKFVPENLPKDSLMESRFPQVLDSKIKWPTEVMQSRANLSFWTSNMLRHGYDKEEMKSVLGYDDAKLEDILSGDSETLSTPTDRIEVRPYPGGRHPRIDFQEGMMSPRRGTEMSIFLPWDSADYVVLDMPEAMMSQFGISFLGHKHIPTVLDLDRVQVQNVDWRQGANGAWFNNWELPNGLEIGAFVNPGLDRVELELTLANHTRDTIFEKLQTQVCVMLGQTKGFASQTNDNKKLTCPVVAVESDVGNQWIITGWEGCSHPWGNEDCPCLHADPSFPDCAPGETVALNGVLWFYEGGDLEGEIDRMRREYRWL